MKWCLGAAVLVLIASVNGAGSRATKLQQDPIALAKTIDRLIGEKLKSTQALSAPLADDAVFFRRVSLTLSGRIPSASHVREFLADKDPDKRRKAIDRLLASGEYVNYLTITWRGWLLPEADTKPEIAAGLPSFEAWLRSRVQSNLPYDKFVTELLTAPVDGRAVRGQRSESEESDGQTNPLAFYIAKDAKPENLAAATARVFLGVQLECAQCHDHPFASWSRDQFWGLAAFFNGIERSDGGLRETLDRREMLIPNSDRAVPATFLDDREPRWRFKESPRATLSQWMTRPDNPFFARAAVNRMWGFVFGVGLVEPVDDFHEKNPPSHPELLDALTRAFVDSGFDIQFLLRALVLSETFQRSSVISAPSQRDVRLYARFPVQGLTPDQFFDSLALAAGVERAKPPETPNAPPAVTPRRQFAEAFALNGRIIESPTTIIQALALMNGNVLGPTTSVETCRTLVAVLDNSTSPAERIDSLYLATVGRPPNANELQKSLAHIGGDAQQSRGRYSDLLWALLSGIEFRTNH
jgi:hypothetical protein